MEIVCPFSVSLSSYPPMSHHHHHCTNSWLQLVTKLSSEETLEWVWGKNHPISVNFLPQKRRMIWNLYHQTMDKRRWRWIINKMPGMNPGMGERNIEKYHNEIFWCRYRTDCHTCMLVQMGEKANYHDLPCEECGRKQRQVYLWRRKFLINILWF